MHPSACKLMTMFFETYVKNKINDPIVYELGSMDNHKEIYSYIPDYVQYTGIDFQKGKNVDVVLEDPYKLPFADESADIVVCSSMLEHCEFFWIIILEMYRVLKPTGLLYINAPSNGSYHTFPIDSWRFYPDAGDSFVNWGKRNGYNPLLKESFINMNHDFPMFMWNDYVCVILKDATNTNLYPNFIMDMHKDIWFGKTETTKMFNISSWTEDQLRLLHLLKEHVKLTQSDAQFAQELKWYGN